MYGKRLSVLVTPQLRSALSTLRREARDVKVAELVRRAVMREAERAKQRAARRAGGVS